jgi:hypothetical protein
MFEQERMIGRLQRRVTGEPAIMACFLSGSFGRRSPDAHSDLDIALVFQNLEAREHAWSNRTAFAQSIMPYLAVKSFDAQHIRPYFHIALYANGSKLDFRYEAQDSLAPNPWDSQVRILKDTQGWAEKFQAASSRMAYPQPMMSSTELVDLDRRFWIMCWDIIRQLARGDSNRPFTIYLEVLHFTLPALLKALPPEDPARKGLIRVSYDLNAKNSLRSMVDLLDAYLAARSAIIGRFSLQLSIDNAFESEIKSMLGKLI